MQRQAVARVALQVSIRVRQGKVHVRIVPPEHIPVQQARHPQPLAQSALPERIRVRAHLVAQSVVPEHILVQQAQHRQPLVQNAPPERIPVQQARHHHLLARLAPVEHILRQLAQPRRLCVGFALPERIQPPVHLLARSVLQECILCKQVQVPRPFARLAPRGICAIRVVLATNSAPPAPTAQAGLIAR